MPARRPGLGHLVRRFGLLAGLVKWEHTIFALPLAYTGAILGSRGWPAPSRWLWITAAMVGARTAAMAFNRVIDREIDARNPRTRDRHLPAGQVGVAEAVGLAAGGMALLALSAWELGPVCTLFLPLVLPLLVLYSYTKRWTYLCHFALAAVQFFGPFGAWLAVTGRVQWGAVLLGGAVGLWIGGFDILYACQDVEFDRRFGVHSLPADLGVPRALWVARATHAVVVALLLTLGWTEGLPWPYWLGVAAATACLVAEHAMVSPRDLSRVPVAFFQLNSYVSLVLFAGAALSALRFPGA
jgi:4-hydroxybenzoate polyprenyltransferase